MKGQSKSKQTKIALLLGWSPRSYSWSRNFLHKYSSHDAKTVENACSPDSISHFIEGSLNSSSWVDEPLYQVHKLSKYKRNCYI